MIRVRSWVMVAVLGLFAACGGGSGGSPLQRGGAGGADAMSNAGSSGGSTEPMCTGTAPCVCANGLDGKLNCDTKMCDCTMCPEYAPGQEPAFETCGGDATGLWRLSKEDVKEFALTLTDAAGVGVKKCPGQLVSQAADSTFLLEVKSDGTAEFYETVADRVVNFTSSCLTSCQNSPDLDCTEQDCGLCSCTFKGSASSADDLRWKAADGILTLTGLETLDTLPYCVKGDTLEYQPEAANMRLTFQRVYRTGVPLACAKRTAANCQSGDCTLGQCVGTGSCSNGFDATSCAKYQDCSWDPSSCYGDVPERCSVSDFENGVPGCVVSDKPSVCGGTAVICADQPECAAKGCLIGKGCVGGHKNPCFIDQGVKGCTCTSSSNCNGTFDCNDVSEDHCNSAGLTGTCHWRSDACVATPTPCQQLSANECETTAGCQLMAP